jgi:hypothetical protein
MPSPDTPPRFIIGIGVANYDDATLNLAAVPEDVAKITGWFTHQAPMPHARVLPELAESPTSHEILTKLRQWLGARNPEDYVVIYVAAHGEVEAGRAYVQGRDSPRERLAGAAIDGDTIGRIIGQSPPHNVLLIIDACVAGRLGDAVQRGAMDAANEFNTRDPFRRRWSQAILCSTFNRDPAFDGLFAKAFLTVVTQERWTGTTSPYVNFDTLMTGLNEELKSIELPQVAERLVWGPGAAELIPNPNYGTRQSSALIVDEELASHFDPASRGVTRGESGSYFIGRHEELARLVAWLAGESVAVAPQMMVITGSPGSGKSALISRVIILSDRTLRARVPNLHLLRRDTVPPESSITAAVWCHNKTLEQMVGDIGARLGINTRTASALLQAVSVRSAPLTIAVDALDEAVEGHATLIATELLVPLAATPGVRVLVATRPHPVHGSTGKPATLLDALRVDPQDPASCIVVDQAVHRVKDLREYVEARLLAKGEPDRRTPYSDHPEVAARVAEHVVEAAGTSFLVAAVTARALATRADIVSSDDLRSLPTEAGAALARYIERLADPQMVRDLLRPLAWAEGTGLPWGLIWAPLATAMARAAWPDTPVAYSDDDVAAVLGRASDLVVEGTEWGQPVYRLFHVALAEHLRADLAPAVAHAALATLLDTILGAPPYQTAPAYALAHMTSHLAQAGRRERLYELVTSPQWERAKRERFGSDADFLHDVDLAIDAAMTPPLDVASLAGACLVYARHMAVAPAPIVSVIAKSGQMERAELMASNLAFAIERCWAYTLIAPTLHAERDVAGVLRCLDEAERAIAAINVTHSAMAWAWVASAAKECDLPERARAAARAAAESRKERISATDDWDLSNVYFWAGVASWHAGDDETRALLRAEFVSRGDQPWKNQTLQAASVLGDTDRLRKVWLDWIASDRIGLSIVRDGNLALALAHAGMKTELDAMLAVIGREELGPAYEADSRKHLVWACAMAGRFDLAFRALQTIDDTEHWLRALGRIVDEAWRQNDAQARERATDLAKRVDTLPDQRSRTLLVPILYDLNEKERALLFADEIIREGVEPSARTTVAFPGRPFDDPKAGARKRRGKTDRRYLETDIASLQDETAANQAIALAREGKLEEARGYLPGIRIPRFRSGVLREIAAATREPAVAIDRWYDALLNARKINERHTRGILVELAKLLADKKGHASDLEPLVASAQAITKAWTEAKLAGEYEMQRNLLRSGIGRTRRMEDLIIATTRTLSEADDDREASVLSLPQELLWGTLFPLARLWTGDEVDRLIASGNAGKRMFAIVLMQSRLSLASLDRAITLMSTSLSAFEQWHSLLVASNLVPTLTPAEGDTLRAAIARERARYVTPETDRYRLTELILDQLSRG